jgi:presenilin 1
MNQIELQNIRNRTMNREGGLEPEAPANYKLHTDGGDEEQVPLSPSRKSKRPDIFRDENKAGEDDDDESYIEREMTLQELMYSSSSFYAIVVPVSIAMILSALAVVFINTETTLAKGAEDMAASYQYFDTSNATTFDTLMLSLMNSLIMVSVIGCMTFVIVLLYKYKCMWCLIGYMMLASTSLLGFLGGNIWYTAIAIYNLPVDKFTYVMVLWNFAAVGILAIFYGKGVPKFVTQSYLVFTSVILAWHLSFFDDVMAWSFLFMLAVYDLCAVLTPCGPLKALVNLMSEEDAPDMPGLLYEAELPPEARRPGAAPSSQNYGGRGTDSVSTSRSAAESTAFSSASSTQSSGLRLELPLAVAQVYNLPVLDLPEKSKKIFRQSSDSSGSDRPLLNGGSDNPSIEMPQNPSKKQLRADVLVELPVNGGRIERIRRKGKNVFMERNRHGEPKRILWVDRQGRVFAESAEYGEDDEEIEESGRNSIRLGLGDFIFYSVMVAKAAETSFTTFIACMLVILAGLGGTLILLSVFHHALPALPISIFLGIFFYLITRFFIQPWVEEGILLKPYYV